jgi:hypothetical protein
MLNIFNCRRGFSDSGGGPPAKQRDLEGAVNRYVLKILKSSATDSPVIPATGETQIRRNLVQSQPGEKMRW